MKRLLTLIALIFLLGSCGSNQNHGYGYNVKSEIPASSVPDTSTHPQEKESWVTRTARNNSARYMDLYDLNGKKVDYCRVLKGTFDGHTWYVFTDREGEFCVIEAK